LAKAKTVVVAAPARRRAPTAKKKRAGTRRKKKPDLVEDLLAVAAGYVGSDLLPSIPLVGPSLAKLKVAPQIPTAALAYVGGKLAGGDWKRAGKLAALGAALNLLVLRAKEKAEKEEPKTKGELGEAANQRLLSAAELFEELEARAEEAPRVVAPLRRLGELVR